MLSLLASPPFAGGSLGRTYFYWLPHDPFFCLHATYKILMGPAGVNEPSALIGFLCFLLYYFKIQEGILARKRELRRGQGGKQASF